jgi:hypothetical protein
VFRNAPRMSASAPVTLHRNLIDHTGITVQESGGCRQLSSAPHVLPTPPQGPLLPNEKSADQQGGWRKRRCLPGKLKSDSILAAALGHLLLLLCPVLLHRAGCRAP